MNYFKKTLIVTLFLGSIYTVFSHNDTQRQNYQLSSRTDTIKHKNAALIDSLSFTIRRIKIDTLKNKINAEEVNDIQLTYDFVYQYPYYKVIPKKWQWQVGDQIQFRFNKLPPNGYIYVFSIDGANNATILPLIKIDSSLKLPLIYPDSTKAMTFDKIGIERICLWYSKDSISNVNKKIEGIELTYGSFVFRANGQIAGKLLLPSMGWHFFDANIGFITDATLYRIPDGFILPTIIEFDLPIRQVKKR